MGQSSATGRVCFFIQICALRAKVQPDYLQMESERGLSKLHARLYGGVQPPDTASCIQELQQKSTKVMLVILIHHAKEIINCHRQQQGKGAKHSKVFVNQDEVDDRPREEKDDAANRICVSKVTEVMYNEKFVPSCDEA
ncbi:hypothetical protein BaRGS_00039659 [Batillaria attramentaria]|uniref:Uncharacterized protein n=1 Tax=Batillaria attramentaria TaxID=370345 RepID=A0ABD0J2G1_9CAEN